MYYRKYGNICSEALHILANAILREILNSNIDGDSTIYSRLLDLSKAFERVDHAKLLTKLQENHLPPLILNMIKFILFNTRICVNFNGPFSPEWNIVRGVRQGGVSSTFLFNIYINEIIECLSHLNLGCKIGINTVNIMAYADDIILLSPSVKSLQFLIDKISELFNDHLLTINVNKTVVIIFKRKSPLSRNIRLYFIFNGEKLNVVNKCKYLGCIITSDMKDSYDIDRCNISFNKSFGFLFILFRKFYSVNIDVFYSLFQSYCSSFYGAELWIDRKRCLGNLKQCGRGVSYHSALKKILSIPKFYSNHFTCNALNTLTFENFINFKCLKFLFWLSKCNSDCFYRHKFYFLNNSNYIFPILMNFGSINMELQMF